MLFKSLSIQKWRQFDAIDITFDKSLTVITGSNGAGKTTILNLLNRHFGWSLPIIATPRRRRDSIQDYLFSTDTWIEEKIPPAGMVLLSTNTQKEKELDADDLDDDQISLDFDPNQKKIGEIIYDDGGVTPLLVPSTQNEAAYHVIIPSQRAVAGVHIPSHRAVPVYQPIAWYPAKRRTRHDLFAEYQAILLARLQGQPLQTLYGQILSPQFSIKAGLFGLALHGYGNSNTRAGHSESRQLFEEYQRILRTILPPTLGFRRFRLRESEIILVTESGNFTFESISGGIAALIDLAWQIFIFPYSDNGCVVTIDEPENHLHPEIQRTLLPNLLSAFPKVQFVVTTHNPFIITSVPSSLVYVLRTSGEKKKRVNS